MEIQPENGFKEVLQSLSELNPEKASNSLQTLFMSDINNEEYAFTSRCCNLWQDYLMRQDRRAEDSYTKGDFLLLNWKNFMDYLKRQPEVYDPAVFAIQRGVFSKALEQYLKAAEENPAAKADIFRKTGICYKHLGEYENACRFLTDANRLQSGRADILADLADCFALTGNERNAKVLFREAFYIDPLKIELDFLVSGLIRCLINELEDKEFPSQQVLSCWIPVYGVIWGIFNIKRELGSKDLGNLKKEIFALENENKNPSSNSALIVPRLINLYFWLADYYISKNDNTGQLDEIKLKIKILDTSIYEQYVK